MELHKWLANVVGSTVAQSAFYEEVFKELLIYGKAYPAEIKGWSRVSKSVWLKRLCDLQILTKSKEGFRGRWFYRWNPHFLGYLNELYKKIKKVL